MYSGRAWVFGDQVSTDAIIPARYMSSRDQRNWAGAVLADLRPEFPDQVGFGDFIVAGRNFGCGSAREQAPLAIKASGIRAVIAHSFARLFFRNAFNCGLLIFTCPEAADRIHDGDRLNLDPFRGMVEDTDQGVSFQTEPIDPFLAKLVSRGGLMRMVGNRPPGR